MKKIIFLMLMLCLFIPSVFAAGNQDTVHTDRQGEASAVPSILINQVDMASVQKLIGKVMEQQEKETGVKFVRKTEAGALTFSTENDIQKDGKPGKADVALKYLLEQRGSDVLVKLQSEVTVKMNDGTVMGPYTTFTDAKKSYHSLDGLKAYFNGEYIMGYSAGKKVQEGFVIEAVPAGFPFADSGIKAGDIMVSVNGKKTVDYEEEFSLTGLQDLFSGKAVEYEILRDGKIAKYAVTPMFIAPEEFQKQFNLNE